MGQVDSFEVGLAPSSVPTSLTWQTATPKGKVKFVTRDRYNMRLRKIGNFKEKTVFTADVNLSVIIIEPLESSLSLKPSMSLFVF